jgi:hypothetical protein
MCQKKRIASTAQVALTLLTCSRSDLVGCLVAQLLLRVCVLNSSMSLWCFQVKGKCSQLLFLNYGHSSLSDGNRWVEMHKSRNLYLHVSSQCWSTGGIKCTWHGAPSCHANCRTSLHSRLYKVLIDNRTAVFSHIQSAALSQIVKKYLLWKAGKRWSCVWLADFVSFFRSSSFSSLDLTNA